VASASAAHFTSLSFAAETAARNRSTGESTGSGIFARACRLATRKTAAHAAIAASAAAPIARNGPRGYPTFRGGRSGAGSIPSFFFSTE
jgi:hypothetical protein